MANETNQTVVEAMNRLRNAASSDSIDMRARVERWLAFYSAHGETGQTAMFDEYKARFLTTRTQMSKRFFSFQNEIGDIVDKRAEAIPQTFAIRAKGNHAKWAEQWTGAKHFRSNGEGTLFDFQEEWNRYTEKTGNLLVVLAWDQQGRVIATRMHTGDADVLYDSQDISKVYGYVFRWTAHYRDEKNNQQTAKLEYRVDATKYEMKIDGTVTQSQQHGLPFVPAVHVPAKKLDDFPLAMSVIEELVEPQLLVNATVTDIRMANRLGVTPMFYGSVSGFEWAPGAFFECEPTDAIHRLETNPNTVTLESELNRHLSKMYYVGRVSRKSDEEIRAAGSAPSGKALLVLNRDGIQYVERRVGILAGKWSELLGKAAVMARQVTPDVWAKEQRSLFEIQYPALDLEDPGDLREEAKIATAVYDAGLMTDLRFMELLQMKGVLPESWDLQTILDEAQDEAEAKAAAQPTVFAQPEPSEAENEPTEDESTDDEPTEDADSE